VTWTKVTGSGTNNELIDDGAANYGSTGLRQRGTKVFFSGSNTADSAAFYGYAEDTGSGYTTATASSSSGTDGIFIATGMEIQYFPVETGANKYRFILVGRSIGGATVRALYMKGDLSGPTLINFSASALGCHAMGREINDGGNRIAGLLGTGGNASLIPFYFNNDYNGGTLTLTEGSNQNGGGPNVAEVSGFQADSARHPNWGSQHRMVMLNGRAWAVVQQNIGAAGIYRYNLWTSADVTTNSWTNLGETIGSDSTNQQGEMRVVYVSSKNCLLFLWKRGTNSATLTQNLTNGQIYARQVQLDSNGAALSYYPAQQIDGGVALGTFQGGISAHPHPDGCGVSWVKSTNIIRAQKFA
jgi:hypothetical protein